MRVNCPLHSNPDQLDSDNNIYGFNSLTINSGAGGGGIYFPTVADCDFSFGSYDKQLFCFHPRQHSPISRLYLENFLAVLCC